MGHRVAVLKDGLLQQCDTPLTLYDAPANLFVAGFIGSPAMNLIEGRVVEGGVAVGDFVVPVLVPVSREVLDKAKGEDRLTVGLRPEGFDISSSDEGLGMHVKVVEELGADAYLYGTIIGHADEEQLVARISSRRPPSRGDDVRLTIKPDAIHVFSNESGLRIS